MSTATLDLVSLFTLSAGDQFDFRSERYMVVKVNPSNAKVKHMVNGIVYNLGRAARVSNVTRATSEERYSALVSTIPTLLVGARVRVTKGKQTGAIGIVTKVTATALQVALDEDVLWRMPESSLERLTKEQYIEALMATI